MAPLALVKNSMAPLACGGMWLLLHRHTIEVAQAHYCVGQAQAHY